MDRRDFLQSGVVTGAAVASAGLVNRSATASANETIRAAVLGVNGRGTTHLNALAKIPNVEIALLVDPDRKVLEKRQAEYEKKLNKKIEIETDLRRAYDRQDIDIVTIATPNHWHALATIWACAAGKDVYVEKPGSHNIFEGRQMVRAAAKYQRIVQHGVQLRSCPALREAVQKMREGLIGDVYLARAVIYRWRPSIGNTGPSAVPDSLDWNLWLGPAAQRDFSRRYVHYNWHWHWDFGNGDIGNQGVHETDMALWGLGVDELPSDIQAMGGKFLWDDDKETPEILSAQALYPDKKKMVQVEVRHWITNPEFQMKTGSLEVGNLFYGSEGILLVKNYESYESYLGKKREPGPKNKSGDPVQAHFENFIEAVRSRDASQLNGPVETAHTSSGLAHLANTSYRLGRRLQFDPKTERFVDDAEANQLLTRDYRDGFEVKEMV